MDEPLLLSQSSDVDFNCPSTSPNEVANNISPIVALVPMSEEETGEIVKRRSSNLANSSTKRKSVTFDELCLKKQCNEDTSKQFVVPEPIMPQSETNIIKDEHAMQSSESTQVRLISETKPNFY